MQRVQTILNWGVVQGGGCNERRTSKHYQFLQGTEWEKKDFWGGGGVGKNTTFGEKGGSKESQARQITFTGANTSLGENQEETTRGPKKSKAFGKVLMGRRGTLRKQDRIESRGAPPQIEWETRPAKEKQGWFRKKKPQTKNLKKETKKTQKQTGLPGKTKPQRKKPPYTILVCGGVTVLG